MKTSNQLSPFLILMACAAAFVIGTGLSLPTVIASHFGPSGTPDGFMSRGIYIGMMLLLIVVLPFFTVIFTRRSVTKPNARINLPNREYWLSPERREQTIAYLQNGMLQFGIMLMTFLCYVHWLVVRANQSQIVQLNTPWLIVGLGVFLIATFIWVKKLLARFKLRV